MALDIENYLQAKNDTIPNVRAPLLSAYPNGYVDTIRLPLALSWVMSTVIDTEGVTGENTIQIDVFVQALAQGVQRVVKKTCKDLRDLFIAEYAITADDMWISTDPPIKIIPGTVQFSGFRDVITAPDETPFHGFTISMQSTMWIVSDCP